MARRRARNAKNNARRKVVRAERRAKTAAQTSTDEEAKAAELENHSDPERELESEDPEAAANSTTIDHDANHLVEEEDIFTSADDSLPPVGSVRTRTQIVYYNPDPESDDSTNAALP